MDSKLLMQVALTEIDLDLKPSQHQTSSQTQQVRAQSHFWLS